MVEGSRHNINMYRFLLGHHCSILNAQMLTSRFEDGAFLEAFLVKIRIGVRVGIKSEFMMSVEN